ncbi:PIG-L deacetylase family protein [Acinetobacter nosocomialis]|uniref:PIG-L deacetylase family protein n=1 Tax=Acinetobacter nosocomialis TaxID=106654 RepID=UPI001962D98A|nr:PIG-L family deacetylase [Acinetobacter nosocomialis]MBM9549771.1 PIG-L family deacetylase [Acinetobacter nosocomialis]MCJ9032494.1 PIG-L family deacetylase [Acinetobacter nosocomialis]
MGTLTHPLVEDRVISGEGTPKFKWLEAFKTHPLDGLNLQLFRSKRVVIVAPHPDDEVLGCGGLMQQLVEQNCHIVILAVSNGTQSHPHSVKYTPDQLNDLRPQETLAALNTLGISAFSERIGLNLMDGQIHLQTDQLNQALSQIVQPEDILICSYALDGHPDHEAVGKTVQAFAEARDLLCLHVLIWAWHWAEPFDTRINWSKAKAYALTENQLIKKHQAVMQFKTQLEADESTGNSAVLSSSAISRLLMPYEVYLSDSFSCVF